MSGSQQPQVESKGKTLPEYLLPNDWATAFTSSFGVSEKHAWEANLSTASLRCEGQALISTLCVGIAKDVTQALERVQKRSHTPSGVSHTSVDEHGRTAYLYLYNAFVGNR